MVFVVRVNNGVVCLLSQGQPLSTMWLQTVNKEQGGSERWGVDICKLLTVSGWIQGSSLRHLGQAFQGSAANT
jgi:hypothetical protein